MESDVGKVGYEIRYIRRGKGERQDIIYASLYRVFEDGRDELVISADMDYIVGELEDQERFSDL